MSGSRPVRGWAKCLLGIGVAAFAVAAVLAWQGAEEANALAERNCGKRDLVTSLDPEFLAYETDWATLGVLLDQVEKAGAFDATAWFAEASASQELPAPEVEVRDLPSEVGGRALQEVSVRWPDVAPEGVAAVLEQAESRQPCLRLRSADIRALPGGRASARAVFATIAKP